ncbi:DUF1570 domain-containing protein [Allorhodopirellula heiligendammensis]|uniref:DUF1570 domain-containing protein n=1 Tax=Allorhodopirellula heiligendammensis TaxID=2714739 RepID=A0A5C6C0V5_9BACT|nr:DUF1570 domain-containing protein [Allorhodopirellula heiligendammensis]TWU16804.1 hypothetical protein Poly21_40110 [Allorhodopirellula heiligendammensis]
MPRPAVFCSVAVVLCLLLPELSSTGQADYTVYQLPGTSLQLLLEGSVTYHAGGNVTHQHPRGSLHFSAQDIQVLKSPTPQSVYAKRLREVRKLGDVNEVLELAKWALKNGMLEESKSLLSVAWKIDSSDERLVKLADLMRYINHSVPDNPEVEQHARQFVGSDRMVATRSKHFLLLHDANTATDEVTHKTRAEMRLELLEKVYESYLLTFAFEGVFLRPPNQPLEVVLFSRQADFMQMERRLGGSLKQTAGFYLPKENISMFYDSGTSEEFQVLMELDRQLVKLRETAKQARGPGAGQLIRFAKTIELLIDITRESEDVSTVSHEAIHHLAANTGVFPRDGAFVRWVHEGMASYFESAKLAKWSGVGVVDSSRISYYRVLEGDPHRGSLEFIVSDLGFLVETALGDQLPAYGQAWALTHFLFNEHFMELMQYYKKVGQLEEHEGDMTAAILKERSENLLSVFDECFGDRTKLEMEWRRYMRTLRTDMERLAENRAGGTGPTR